MRTWAIMLRILRQFRRDKRTVALMFIAPLLVLTLMNLVFNGKDYVPRIGITGNSTALAAMLEKQDAKVIVYDSSDQAEKALQGQEIDAVVSAGNHKAPAIRLEGSDPTANRSVMELMQSALSGQNPGADAAKPEITYLHGSGDMSTIDHLGPVLIGFFIFFFVFLIAGVAFLRERTTGTLERLLASPVRRSEIVLGYVGGFGLFTIAQALLITWYSIKVLGIVMAGSFGYVLLLTLLLSLTALTLGTLLSAYANNELQMIQFIPLIIVPQLFLSGLFNLDTLPDWLAACRVVMPMYYGAQGLSDVMIRGQGWSAIAQSVYVLLGFCLLFTVLNILALRKHRKI
ncbi:ABC transporter permease [Paenibacillus caui]|uniref:ABC transporter permease n=1 Tax=Paenibacillus caui TaxID=2873927 RepID=UPI001CA920FC|nr:ABC transporter permease [Paenibacillus caui]